jgi:hypothetical protein
LNKGNKGKIKKKDLGQTCTSREAFPRYTTWCGRTGSWLKSDASQAASRLSLSARTPIGTGKQKTKKFKKKKWVRG